MSENIFENNEEIVQEATMQAFVEDPSQRILPENPEIVATREAIVKLKAMGLHRTAEFNQRKLDRLLREEQETLEEG